MIPVGDEEVVLVAWKRAVPVIAADYHAVRTGTEILVCLVSN